MVSDHFRYHSRGVPANASFAEVACQGTTHRSIVFLLFAKTTKSKRQAGKQESAKRRTIRTIIPPHPISLAALLHFHFRRSDPLLPPCGEQNADRLAGRSPIKAQGQGPHRPRRGPRPNIGGRRAINCVSVSVCECVSLRRQSVRAKTRGSGQQGRQRTARICHLLFLPSLSRCLACVGLGAIADCGAAPDGPFYSSRAVLLRARGDMAVTFAVVAGLAFAAGGIPGYDLIKTLSSHVSIFLSGKCHRSNLLDI